MALAQTEFHRRINERLEAMERALAIQADTRMQMAATQRVDHALMAQYFGHVGFTPQEMPYSQYFHPLPSTGPPFPPYPSYQQPPREDMDRRG